MSNVIPLLSGEKLKWLGSFDFRNLYFQLHKGMERDGWDIKEKRYVEKSKPGAENKNVEIIWEATLDIDNYTRAKIDIFFDLTDVTEPMTEWEPGITRPIFKGAIDIVFSYSLITDYNDEWSKHPVLRSFQKFYENKIYRKTLDGLKGEHWGYGWGYVNWLKELMQMVAIA